MTHEDLVLPRCPVHTSEIQDVIFSLTRKSSDNSYNIKTLPQMTQPGLVTGPNPSQSNRGPIYPLTHGAFLTQVWQPLGANVYFEPMRVLKTAFNNPAGKKTSQLAKVKRSDQAIVVKVLSVLDGEKDNTIDFLEYVAALNLALRGKLEHKLKWSFKIYDKDGNGCIDKKELKEIIQSIYSIKKDWKRAQDTQLLSPDDICERIFRLVDENGDGQLTLHEFVEGAKNDRWVSRMLQLDTNPCTWFMEQRRKSALF